VRFVSRSYIHYPLDLAGGGHLRLFLLCSRELKVWKDAVRARRLRLVGIMDIFRAGSGTRDVIWAEDRGRVRKMFR
jgi:hypothetical protein